MIHLLKYVIVGKVNLLSVGIMNLVLCQAEASFKLQCSKVRWTQARKVEGNHLNV